jgi:osmotically-inducible protein OsmY
MKTENRFKIIVTSILIASALTACDNKGPAESAGKKIDQAAENASIAASKSAERTSDAISETGKSTGQVIDDTEITAKIKMLYLKEPELKSLNISVSTEKGVVVLTGTANTKSNADTAVKIAESVSGVSKVVNQISFPK